jgi:hypothetical protein
MWLTELDGGSEGSRNTAIPGLAFRGEQDEIGVPEDRASDEERGHGGVPIERPWRAPRHGSAWSLVAASRV